MSALKTTAARMPRQKYYKELFAVNSKLAGSSWGVQKEKGSYGFYMGIVKEI